MFQRQATRELDKWRSHQHRKPLLLRGARQVGKTTIVNEFGKTFSNYLYFNLERAEDRRLFESDMPLDDLILTLFLARSKPRLAGETLIFIDEIQNSPHTIALLRYFYEDHPELHVIAAGSLLENLIDTQVSFPVGRVSYLPIRPASFLEFATALGLGNLIELARDTRSIQAVHSQLSSLFNQYLLTGGMPSAVQAYSESHDLLSMDDIYETLLQAYRDDVEKYVRGKKLTEVVRFILSQGWYEAGSTITLGNFGNSGYRSTEVGEAFRLLHKAMLAELVYPSSSTTVPVIPDMRRHPKLIWLDTGLVNYAANVRNQIIGSTDIVDVWKGRISEHVVAQELLTLNFKISQTRAFWARPSNGNSAEVDFVWTVDSQVIPIEVKTGSNSHLRSLHSFIERSPINVAVRIWSGPYSVNDVETPIQKKKFKLINLPYYLIWNLESIVRQQL